MRLIYAADKQASLRLAWVDVIYLNVIMALKLLLEAMENIETMELQRTQASMDESTSTLPGPLRRLHSSGGFTVNSMSSGTATIKEPSKVLLARLRLAPFLSIESELRKRLGAFERDVGSQTMPQSRSAPGDLGGKSVDSSLRSGLGSVCLRRHQYVSDIVLRAGWQDEFIRPSMSCSETDTCSVAASTASSARRRTGLSSRLIRRRTATGDDRGIAMQTSSRYTIQQKEDDPSRLLSACVHEIRELWEGVTSAEIKARIYGADSAA
jgi:hypothetical protein